MALFTNAPFTVGVAVLRHTLRGVLSVSVPTILMRNWIANLISRFRKPESMTLNLPCVYSVVDNFVRVDVLENVLPCGHSAYLIHADYYFEEPREWLQTAALRDFNLESTIKLLNKAQSFVSQMQHGLVTSR